MASRKAIAEAGKQVLGENVDLAEAEKLLDYFVHRDFDSAAVNKYLSLMSESPPPRSRRSQLHFKNLKQIWDGWKPSLEREDKARA